MIKLFRNIRQKHIKEGKTANYLKYAIGEIILVVIGILIALQINNWNENRKARLNEKAILISLKEELNLSLQELKSDFNRLNNFNKSTENVYSYIQNKPILVDSMFKDFYGIVNFNISFLKTSGYQSLKSGKIEIIQSDTLRELITDIYETGYQRIKEKIDTRRNAAELLFPYYQKHFKSKILTDSIDIRRTVIGIPNDYKALIHDPEFETLIVEAIIGRNNVFNDYDFTIQLVEDCIAKIDAYLKP